MNLELGETYSTRFNVTKSDGTPGAANVTLTAFLPDGTVSAPISVPTSALGDYDVDYVTTQVGRCELTISATGGDLGPLVRKTVDIINVDPVLSGALISVSDAKEHLNIPSEDKGHDNELQAMVLVASRFVESRTQCWHRTTVTETFRRPGRALLLTQRPVVSVTSVVVDGLTSETLSFVVRSDSGIVERPAGYWGGQAATVTYVVGAGYVPPDVRHAVKVVLAHLWRTQRGSSVMGTGGPDDVWDPSFGFSYPRAVAEMLEAYAPGVAFA